MNLKQIKAAQKRTEQIIKKIHLEYSPFFSKLVNGDVYLKLENLQLTGSFKIRGALNKILKLKPKEKKKGVLTVSAGNHGQGIGYGAKLLGIKAIVIVPKNTPKIKIKAIEQYGIDLKILGKDYDEAEAEARELERKTGMVYISPYNDADVIAGQGTIGLEILKENPNIDTILVPVGGGGLISGIAIAVKSINPKIKVIGAQSAASPVMYESLKAGKITGMKVKPSVAEGLHGGIEKESITFDLVKNYVDSMLLVSEAEIKNAIRLFFKSHHQIAEGAGVVGLAALLRYKKQFKVHKIAVVISGGNLDKKLLKKILH